LLQGLSASTARLFGIQRPKFNVEEDIVLLTQLFLVWLHSIYVESSLKESPALRMYLLRILYDTRSEVWSYAEHAITCVLIPNANLLREIIQPPSLHRAETICCNRWFTRAWVLQEVSNNQDVRVRILGFETDLYLLHALRNFEIERLGTTAECVPKNSLEVWKRVGNSSKSLLPSQWSSIFRHRFSSGKLELLHLLENLGDFQASDPRDKVFAIYHLATDVSLAFRPDYEANLGDVYAQFTRQIIEQTNKLTLLQFKESDLLTKHLDGIPTWVPDYRAKFQLAVPDWYSAADRTQKSRKVGPNPRLLSLRGFDIAEVIFVEDSTFISQHWNPFPAYYACLDNVFRRLFGKPFTVPHYLEDYTSDRHIPFDIFLQAAFHNAGEDRMLMLAFAWWLEDPNFDLFGEHWRGKQLINRALSKAKAFGERSEPIFKTAIAKAQIDISSRTFFLSDQGSLGICPANTRAGDIVVALDGAGYPMVVRLKSNTPVTGSRVEQMQQQSAYELVGYCYLHGHMHAEIIEDPTWNDVLHADPLDTSPRSSNFCKRIKGSYRRRYYNLV
jgi:hypothetical protein